MPATRGACRGRIVRRWAVLLTALADPARRFDAIVVGEYERAFFAEQLQQLQPLLGRYRRSCGCPSPAAPGVHGVLADQTLGDPSLLTAATEQRTLQVVMVHPMSLGGGGGIRSRVGLARKGQLR
jgi:hypothetical protein